MKKSKRKSPYERLLAAAQEAWTEREIAMNEMGRNLLAEFFKDSVKLYEKTKEKKGN